MAADQIIAILAAFVAFLIARWLINRHKRKKEEEQEAEDGE